MAGQQTDPRDTAAWEALEVIAQGSATLQLPELLAKPDRYAQFSLELGDLIFDFSRQRINDEVFRLLVALAEQRDVPAGIQAMFSGAVVNTSEGRAALHTALRAGVACRAGDAIGAEVAAQLDAFLSFADAVRSGERAGYGGARIRRVVNIGIGGSDLGPRMVVRALSQSGEGPQVGFAAGLDGIELTELLDGAEAAETLFVVCSKTFTTLETRTNADAARAWLLESLPEEAVATNFAAVSVNGPAMDEFGIAPDARFRMWDWVGGRYSVWSAIGLAAAIAVGSDAFRAFLAGARDVDEHFATAPLAENLPVIKALLNVWNRNFLRLGQAVILPYDQRLEEFPHYLQQLVLESLGKTVRSDGGGLSCATTGSLWGNPGSASQHSFAQWLHQGVARASVDYIGTANGPEVLAPTGHLQSLANLIAQAEALAYGQTPEQVREALGAAGRQPDESLVKQKVHPGNRTSSIIMLRELDPRTLGMLIALYEHQVYVQGLIWGINPFDQWGVELGKARARAAADALSDGNVEQLPGIAARIIDWR